MKTVLASLALLLLAPPAVQAATESMRDPQAPDTVSAFPIVDATTGSPREMPLHHAIAKIIPRDYTVRSDSILRLYAQPVSWRGGLDWVKVLREALAPYPQILIYVDNQAKTVTLRLRGVAMASAHPSTGANASAGTSASQVASTATSTSGSGSGISSVASVLKPPVMASLLAASGPADGRSALVARTANRMQAASTPRATPAAAVAPASVIFTAPLAKAEGDKEPADLVWKINLEDRSLRAVFARWTDAAGWQLSWEAPVDYTIDARATLSGSLESAVAAAFKGLIKGDVPLKAVFYKGNKVLRVMTKGAE